MRARGSSGSGSRREGAAVTKTARRRWREYTSVLATNYEAALEWFLLVRAENKRLRDTVEQLRRRVAQLEQETDR